MPSRHRPCLLAFMLCVALAAPAAAQSSLTLSELVDAWSTAYSAANYREAERLARQMRVVAERQQPDWFNWRGMLGLSLFEQGRHAEAAAEFETYLTLCRGRYGADVRTAEALLNLGNSYLNMSRYEDSRSKLEEAISLYTRLLGANHADTLNARGSLALLMGNTGDFDGAAAEYRDIIDRQFKSRVDKLARLNPIHNLVWIYRSQGKYGPAEEMARYGIQLAMSLDSKDGRAQRETIRLVEQLADTYLAQNRADEARILLVPAVQAGDELLGASDPLVCNLRGDLALCYDKLGQLDEAMRLQKQVIDALAAAPGEEPASLGVHYSNYAMMADSANQLDVAEDYARRALAIAERTQGSHHPQTARARNRLADVLMHKDRDAEALPLARQVLADLEAVGMAEEKRYDALRCLAHLTWRGGDRAAALGLMEQAMDLAEAARSASSGAELERAATFAYYNNAYESTIRWQTELGDTQGALDAMERVRARSFLEAMRTAGVDVRQAMSPAEREASQKQEMAFQAEVTRLESELGDIPILRDDEPAATTRTRRRLLDELAAARDALYTFRRQLRAASPLYRQLASAEEKPPSLDDIRSRLVPPGTMLLAYFIGEYNSYALWVSYDEARIVELPLPAAEAEILGLEAGVLTHSDLVTCLLASAEGAILPRLSANNIDADVAAKLNALWRVLVPEGLRPRLTDGGFDRLLILPDGPLALLPFETLVVETSPRVTYALDVAPPMHYGPSAQVLLSLADRPTIAPTAEPVLTVGDPDYAPAGAAPSGGAASRAVVSRQRLSPLKYTRQESMEVAKVFRSAGMPSVQLLGAHSTEGEIRRQIAGREIVHLACHGMSDDEFGNAFGALIVAAGAGGDPRDDGTLTLAEIYDLDLKGCELAILSACMTNHGPEQRGEGVWALSRGFLVSGGRRVIASNWVVDDVAGASLVSVCCGKIAEALGKGQRVDHATALRDAKLWVRQQPQFANPYFWAPLVLIGPN